MATITGMFHDAAHSARTILVAREQQLVALESELDSLWDELMEIPKASRKGHPTRIKYNQVSQKIADVTREVTYWKQSYKDAVALY